MRVLIIGKSGQVARELARMPWPAHYRITQPGRMECDLANAQSLRNAVTAAAPDIVVNAGAYTAVDKAESEPMLANAINAEGPAILAQLCTQSGAALIHLSTDYVFDGEKKDAYNERDSVRPKSVYGRTKEAGESDIRNSLQRHIILRTSWVFSSHGINFVKTILRLTREKQELSVVDDQRGKPTAARDIAQAITAIAARIDNNFNRWGTYHFAGDEAASWCGFARAIVAENVRQGGREIPVHPIGSVDYPTPAKRPANSVLDCVLIQNVFGIAAPSWRAALADVVGELNAAA